MNNDIVQMLYEEMASITLERKKYIAKAFEILPAMDRPSILDVGCGNGGPTLELARRSRGKVIGLDINQAYLDRLIEASQKAGLSEQVGAVRMSMLNIIFPDESFDVVWAEASVNAIGWVQGLKKWRGLLKPGRFLVIHEMVWLRPGPPREILDYWKPRFPEIDTSEQNLKTALACGYGVLGHFPLPEDFWWGEYYERLEKKIEEHQCQPGRQAAELEALASARHEIALYKRHASFFGSAYFILEKNSRD